MVPAARHDLGRADDRGDRDQHALHVFEVRPTSTAAPRLMRYEDPVASKALTEFSFAAYLRRAFSTLRARGNSRRWVNQPAADSPTHNTVDVTCWTPASGWCRKPKVSGQM